MTFLELCSFIAPSDTRADLLLYSHNVAIVWKHLLLQLGAAGSVLLPAVPRKDLGVS